MSPILKAMLDWKIRMWCTSH